VAFTTCLVLAMLASTVSQRARADVADAYQRRRGLSGFFNLSSDVMGIRGTDGYFTRVNPPSIGYSRQELLKRRFRDIVDPGDESPAPDIVDELLAAAGPCDSRTDACAATEPSFGWTGPWCPTIG